MIEIQMPRLGVNDDFVTLVTWLVEDGAWVNSGQAVAEIETSKESSEVTSDFAGRITLLVKEGDDVEVGKPIAGIGEGENPGVENSMIETQSVRMTEKARRLIEKHGIDLAVLPRDRLVREKDVLPFVSKPYVLSGTKNNEIILYGGSGITAAAIDILKVTHAYHVHGIVDIYYPKLKEVMGVPVIGADAQLQALYDDGYRKIFNGVTGGGSRLLRKPAYEKLKKYGFEFPNIIHSRAILEPTASIGEGTMVCAGAIIGTMVRIGNNCLINAGSIISHDCVISDNCHVASGAVLAGVVTVGENTLIGQNVTVYSRVRIGSNVVIENGCCIFKDVPDDTVVKYSAR